MAPTTQRLPATGRWRKGDRATLAACCKRVSVAAGRVPYADWTLSDIDPCQYPGDSVRGDGWVGGAKVSPGT